MDDLYPGHHHRHEPDFGDLSNGNGSPSQDTAAEGHDGFRITWGPGVQSVLAMANIVPGQSYRPSSFATSAAAASNGQLQAIKRDSRHAGLGSPTRQGARPSASSSGRDGVQQQKNGGTTAGGKASPHTDSDASASHSTTSSTSSRYSKRRRKFQTSRSTPNSLFQNTLTRDHNTGAGVERGATTTDNDSLFDELARRLEAKSLAQQQQRQTVPSVHPPAPKESANVAVQAPNVHKHQRSKSSPSKLGKLKTLAPPDCSAIPEEPASAVQQRASKSTPNDGTQSMDIDTPPAPSPHRQVLAVKHDNVARKPQLGLTHQKGTVSRSSHVGAPLFIPSPSKLRPDLQPIPHLPSQENLDPFGEERNSSRCHDTAALAPTSTANGMLADQDHSRSIHGEVSIRSESALQHSSQQRRILAEEDFWDDNSADRDLEVALSQMVIPEPRSSQPQERDSQARPREAKAWGGFARRDQRQQMLSRQNSTDSPLAKANGSGTSAQRQLSTRPFRPSPIAGKGLSRQTSASRHLPVAPPEPAKPLYRSVSHDPTATARGLAAETVRDGPALGRTTSNGATMALSKARSPPSSNGNTFVNAAGSSKLFKAFKPPTIVKPEAANQAKERQQSTKAHILSQQNTKIAQAPPIELEGLDDWDWDNDVDLSF